MGLALLPKPRCSGCRVQDLLSCVQALGSAITFFFLSFFLHLVTSDMQGITPPWVNGMLSLFSLTYSRQNKVSTAGKREAGGKRHRMAA